MFRNISFLAFLVLVCVPTLSAQGSGNIFSEDIETDAGGTMSSIRKAFNKLPFKPSFIGPNTFCERDPETGDVNRNCAVESDSKSRASDGAKVTVDAPTYKSAFDGPRQLNGDMNYVNQALIGNSTSAGSLFITTSSLTDPAFTQGTVGSANIGALGFGNVVNAQDNYYKELEQVPGGKAIDGPAFRGCVKKLIDGDLTHYQGGLPPPLAVERCASGIITSIANIPSGAGSGTYLLSDHPSHQFNQPETEFRHINKPPDLNTLANLNQFRELRLSEMIFGQHYVLGVNLAFSGGDRIARAHTAFTEIVGDRAYRSMDSDGLLSALNNSYSKKLTFKDIRTKAEDYWFIKFFENAYHSLNMALYRYCDIDMRKSGSDPSTYRPSYSTCDDGNFADCNEFKDLQRHLTVNGFSPDVYLIGALYRSENNLRTASTERDPNICNDTFRAAAQSDRGNFYSLFSRVYELRNSNNDDRKNVTQREKAVFEIAFKTAIAKVIEVLMEARNTVLELTGNRGDDWVRDEAIGMIDRYVDNINDAYQQLQQSLNEDIMNTMERDKRRSIAASEGFKNKSPDSGGAPNMGGGLGDNS